jgi:hypothetical protein
MRRHFSHLLGTIAALISMLLWLSLLNPPGADRFVDNLAGAQHEYKIVLCAALLSVSVVIHCRSSWLQMVVCRRGVVVGNVGILYLPSLRLAECDSQHGSALSIECCCLVVPDFCAKLQPNAYQPPPAVFPDFPK